MDSFMINTGNEWHEVFLPFIDFEEECRKTEQELDEYDKSIE